jgi:hypothetical protein
MPGLTFLLLLQHSEAASNGIFLGKKTPVASAAAAAGTLPVASYKAENGVMSSMPSMTTSPPTFSFPTYPAVNDFSSGTCAGEFLKPRLA